MKTKFITTVAFIAFAINSGAAIASATQDLAEKEVLKITPAGAATILTGLRDQTVGITDLATAVTNLKALIGTDAHFAAIHAQMAAVLPIVDIPGNPAGAAVGDYVAVNTAGAGTAAIVATLTSITDQLRAYIRMTTRRLEGTNGSTGAAGSLAADTVVALATPLTMTASGVGGLPATVATEDLMTLAHLTWKINATRL